MTQPKRTKTIVAMIALLSLSACGAGERMANIGKAPDLSPVDNPTTRNEYKTVSMPMPAPSQGHREKNSLWASDRQTFFEDQRATDVGDILTVVIDIADEAALENKSERSRTSSEDSSLNPFFGMEVDFPQVFAEAIDPSNLIDADSTSNHSGEGKTERDEEISMRLAAIVTQVLPNGNLVVQGRQEVRVNFEKRVMELAGVIRPQDISIDNTVSYDQIAEARISYGGQGQLTDMQQPRYGQQVFDILLPF